MKTLPVMAEDGVPAASAAKKAMSLSVSMKVFVWFTLVADSVVSSVTA